MLQADVVSREKDLRLFVELLLKWNRKINLISSNTVKDVWRRHVIDSAQLQSYLSKGEKIVDLGSGAGFPGLVLSIEGYDVTLVESDLKKASFLKEASRVLGVSCTLISDRAENLIISCDTVICRGFADISNIFKIARRIKCGRFLLLKGKNFCYEVDEARKKWSFSLKRFKSITSSDSYVLEIKDVQKKESNSNS